jgi:hypothetical protein
MRNVEKARKFIKKAAVHSYLKARCNYIHLEKRAKSVNTARNFIKQAGLGGLLAKTLGWGLAGYGAMQLYKNNAPKFSSRSSTPASTSTSTPSVPNLVPVETVPSSEPESKPTPEPTPQPESKPTPEPTPQPESKPVTAGSLFKQQYRPGITGRFGDDKNWEAYDHRKHGFGRRSDGSRITGGELLNSWNNLSDEAKLNHLQGIGYVGDNLDGWNKLGIDDQMNYIGMARYAHQHKRQQEARARQQEARARQQGNNHNSSKPKPRIFVPQGTRLSTNTQNKINHINTLYENAVLASQRGDRDEYKRLMDLVIKYEGQLAG